MLRLSKKADYALISLAYLAEHRGHVVPAREVAERCQLPLPLLMNILKVLHQRGILRSVRGASGGERRATEHPRPAALPPHTMAPQDRAASAPGTEKRRR